MLANNKILKNLFSLSVAEMASKGLIFVYTAYLARVLTCDGFGVFGLANSVLVYFALATNLGFNTIGAREIAKSPENLSDYVNSIISIRLLHALVSFSALFVYSYFFLDKPLDVKLIVIVNGFTLFSQAILLDWVYQGTEKMEYLAVRQVVTGILNLTGIFLLIHGPDDIMTAILIIVVSTFLNSLWMLIAYIKLFGPIKLKIIKPIVKPLYFSSFPVAFSAFFAIVLNYFNIILLSTMRSDAETGLYNAAFKILLLTIIPSGIVQMAFFPVISRSAGPEDRNNILTKFSLLMFFFGTFIPVLVIFNAEFLIELIYGANYLGAAMPLRFLMVGSVLTYVSTFVAPPLIAWNYEKWIMITFAVVGAINITMNVMLIPEYGIQGAALSNMVCEFFIALGLSAVFIYKIRHWFIISFLKMLSLSILSSLAGYLLNYLGVHSIATVLISSAMYVTLIFSAKIITISEIKRYLIK